MYEFLFAKNDLDNIDDNELENFRKLAGFYAKLSEEQIQKLLQNKALVELNHENKT